MKKKVAFQKEIEFPTMIGEISAISLEHDLHFIDESNVDGNLLLTGKYKLTEASRLEEDFSYKIPVEISLTEKLELSTAKIDITDFSYEISNEDIMLCNIELLLEGIEVIEEEKEDHSITLEESTEERECDGDKKENKEIELPKIIEREEKKDEIKKSNQIKESQEISQKEEITINEESKEEIEKNVSTEVNSLFVNLNEEKETYGTFLVYIVRQNESINSIIEKYNTSIEEIEKYNNLNDLNIGTKLIIPILND